MLDRRESISDSLLSFSLYEANRVPVVRASILERIYQTVSRLAIEEALEVRIISYEEEGRQPTRRPDVK